MQIDNNQIPPPIINYLFRINRKSEYISFFNDHPICKIQFNDKYYLIPAKKQNNINNKRSG